MILENLQRYFGVSTLKGGPWIFDNEIMIIKGYEGTLPKDLIIPNIIDGTRVKSIDVGSYNSKTEVEKITISYGITSIGNFVFNSWSNLQEITMPSTIDSIGVGAFQLCDPLITIKIDKPLNSIPDAPWGASPEANVVWK